MESVCKRSPAPRFEANCRRTKWHDFQCRDNFISMQPHIPCLYPYTSQPEVIMCDVFSNSKKLCFLPTQHDYVFLMIHKINSDFSLHSINQLVFTMDIDCDLCEIRTNFLFISYMKVNPHIFTFHFNTVFQHAN